MDPPVRLYVSYDEALDWLMAYEFGRVDDGQPPENWRGVSDRFGFLQDGEGGRVVGFKVLEFSDFDPDGAEVQEIWGGPRFDAPALGVIDASAGEIVIAARAHFDGRSSLNRDLFNEATRLQGRKAVDAWRRCLEAGDAMAHFALGYTLLELGEAQTAYRHLRYYTEIAPHGAWNWCWYGRAAEAIGEVAEARRAYRRAIELSEAGDQETDAAERLAALPQPAGSAESSRHARSPTEENRVVLWGDELPHLGRRQVDALSSRAAAGLTAGAQKKAYAHTDPNEDAVAVVDSDGVTVIVCADGHNGMAGARAAVEVALEHLGSPSRELLDLDLVDLWLNANERVLAAGRRAGQPDSRTTLVVALVAAGQVRWAAMGDSLLAIVHGDETVEFLSKRRSHFVGWPMTREEIAERLPRGTVHLASDAWVVAATDGLTDFVTGLRKTLIQAADPSARASHLVERLIDAACAGGAGDNIAVAAVRAAAAPQAGRIERPSVEMRIRGCVFGGAVGDALGAAIEFESIEEIRTRFGPSGVTDYEVAYGRRGAITDDTQMSLFTAEGLIRAYVRGSLKGLCHPPSVVDHAYARWLLTQGERSTRWESESFDGWLLSNRALHHARAPGKTCLAALRADRMGTMSEPLNGSKGCGGVMRIAPVGLLGPTFPGERFELACDIAALTHGHPSGYLAAGVLAEVVHGLVWTDGTLDEALDGAIRRLRQAPQHEETLAALEAARALAASSVDPSPEAIATLGAGWVAEEALAIGMYCALVACDFAHGVLLAVNHSGDSDSTGAIAGNVLGAIHGIDEIPARWIHDLEVHEVIEAMCRDWTTLFAREDDVDLEGDETWWNRYPGW